MKVIEVNRIREWSRDLTANSDIDYAFTFFRDESNNMRKLRLRGPEFNYSVNSDFVLGGLVYGGQPHDIDDLFERLKLPSTVADVKLKHLAKGNFLTCLTSKKLNYFLSYLFEHDGWVHYSRINLLYYSITDIVDSAIINLDQELGYDVNFSRLLKNNLYQVARKEIKKFLKLFHQFNYPNVPSSSRVDFIDSLTEIFEEYEESLKYHLGLTSLKQILREAKKQNSMRFLKGEDHVLLKDFSDFYLNPLWLFKNSKHIFDREDSIEAILAEYKLVDDGKEIRNYTFDRSVNRQLHAADIFVGLTGKLSEFANIRTESRIKKELKGLSALQKSSLTLYFDLLTKSDIRCPAFFHYVVPDESIEKMMLIEKTVY